MSEGAFARQTLLGVLLRLAVPRQALLDHARGQTHALWFEFCTLPLEYSLGSGGVCARLPVCRCTAARLGITSGCTCIDARLKLRQALLHDFRGQTQAFHLDSALCLNRSTMWVVAECYKLWINADSSGLTAHLQIAAACL